MRQQGGDGKQADKLWCGKLLWVTGVARHVAGEGVR